ncbi:MAG: hypothetical protein HYS98_08525 [Deltaproteobacteria bacterium]|nr:hypothetical protein [Deltaproteobacteria bacterium]
MIAPGITEEQLQFFKNQKLDDFHKHVHEIHLDGYRPDLFKALLESGQLPHFAFLLSRGKVSFEASTVDKTETMKAKLSHLTSRFDTEVVGWWQWGRSDFSFKNYWMDPIEVINYALGLTFPLYPTIFDFLTSQGHNVTAGFSLHRRSVPFENYSRNYEQGFKAAYDHTYLDQALASMQGVIQTYERIVQSKTEMLPIYSNSLLAAADEFAHYEGVIGRKPVSCFNQSDNDETVQTLLDILTQDEGESKELQSIYQAGLTEEEVKKGRARGYFTEIKSERLLNVVGKRIVRFCIKNPKIFGYFEDSQKDYPDVRNIPLQAEYAHPKYVLGMILNDILLGKLINTLRSIRFGSVIARPSEKAVAIFRKESGNGILNYLQKGQLENSLFEHTLFSFYGDHGMAHTPHQMLDREDNKYLISKLWHPQGFLNYLNVSLGMRSLPKNNGSSIDLKDDEVIGIDFEHLPERLKFQHKYPHWYATEGKRKMIHAEGRSITVETFVNEKSKQASDIFNEFSVLAKEKIADNFWWFLFLKNFFKAYFIDPEFEKQVHNYKQPIMDHLTRILLKSNSGYVDLENEANLEYLNQYVRLIYGGGARNNAEIFIPHFKDAQFTWKERPTLNEIINYKVYPDKPGILDALLSHRSVGLVFIREKNELFDENSQLPKTSRILVMDRFQNKSFITVKNDVEKRIYGYEIHPASKLDPLGYFDVVKNSKTIWKSYHEWNDWCLKKRTYYHNAVAGIGSYLYSNNPAVGDILVTHSQGWNFGYNKGGHGGLHREEKLTIMMISGPEIQTGELFATEDSGFQTHPIIVDAVPSILSWLGFGKNALSNYAKSGQFAIDFEEWNKKQKEDIVSNLDNIDSLIELLKKNGLSDIKPSDFAQRWKQIFQFIPGKTPPLPDFSNFKEDGNQLPLRTK